MLTNTGGALVVAVVVACGGFASLLATTRRPTLRPWSWVFLLVTAGGIGFVLLLLAGPFAVWLIANWPP
jgi:hypothetical protein